MNLHTCVETLGRWVGRGFGPAGGALDDSGVVSDRAVLRAFFANPKNTFLVSFPRTGSHWLRMVMELYFERPSLTRVFYFPEKTDYLTYHTHDLDLDVVRTHVLYLYREPVDTVYSQLCYHGEDCEDAARVRYWSDLYGRHLDKWLHRENFTRAKTVLRYEALKADMAAEFEKICRHFHQRLDAGRLAAAAGHVSRAHVKEKTAHDPRVVTLGGDYESGRAAFRERLGPVVWEALLTGREHLRHDF